MFKVTELARNKARHAYIRVFIHSFHKSLFSKGLHILDIGKIAGIKSDKVPIHKEPSF